jgi:hypothetical protein
MLAKIKQKYKDFTHWHQWSYLTYLHRQCNCCPAKQKRRAPWFFVGTNAKLFEKTWIKFQGTDLEFEEEAKVFAANLKKCKVHNMVEEKMRFGIFAVYNETAIRQNRAFPHYGVAYINEKLE